MSKADIWMPLYIGDYLAATARLTTEQHGAYLLLIMDYWRNGPPPDDDGVLCQITRLSVDSWSQARSALSQFFSIENGAWLHNRIEKEKGRATTNNEARSKSGSLGAASKWGNADNENKLKRAERLANARRLGRHSAGEWETLKQVCGESCLKCGSIETLVKDHIIPLYQNGSDSIENIQPLCRTCNAAKGPDSTDHRPTGWKESLAKCLANVYQMPVPSPSPSQLNPPSQDGKLVSRGASWK